MELIFTFAANHRYRKHADELKTSLENLGQKYIAVDLGGLGYGIPMTVQDGTFQSLGFYQTIFSSYPTPAMHKPDAVQAAYEQIGFGDILVSLDADCVLMDSIDEIKGMDFDVAVTHVSQFDEFILKYMPLNSGVIFFRRSDAATKFIIDWKQQTIEGGDDQQGLVWSVERMRDQIKIIELPCETYNRPHGPEHDLPVPSKILHHMVSSRNSTVKRLWELRAAQG